MSEPNLGGRPAWVPTAAQLNELSKLGAFQATLNEVAAWFDVAPKTIDNRLAEDTAYEFEGKQLTFREIFEHGKLKGKANLRRLQMIQAERGNPTMLIWLGKQLLGQRDNIEVTGPNAGPLLTRDVSPRQLIEARIASVLAADAASEDPGRPD